MGDIGMFEPVEISIVPMAVEHLGGVADLERRCQAAPWSEELFRADLDHPDEAIWRVAVDGAGAVIGFGGLYCCAPEGHVHNLATDPGLRRRGLASGLLAAVIRDGLTRGVRHVTLEVRAGNVAAKELYRRFGFLPGGVRPRYYQPEGEDALILWAHDVDTEAYGRRLDELAPQTAQPEWVRR